jgi:hypothetical protein
MLCSFNLVALKPVSPVNVAVRAASDPSRPVANIRLILVDAVETASGLILERLVRSPMMRLEERRICFGRPILVDVMVLVVLVVLVLVAMLPGLFLPRPVA